MDLGRVTYMHLKWIWTIPRSKLDRAVGAVGGRAVRRIVALCLALISAWPAHLYPVFYRQE